MKNYSTAFALLAGGFLAVVYYDHTHGKAEWFDYVAIVFSVVLFVWAGKVDE